MSCRFVSGKVTGLIISISRLNGLKTVLQKELLIKTGLSEEDFKKYYESIEKVVKAKTLGLASNEVKEVLNNLNTKIKNPSKDFSDKWNFLYNFALKGNMDLSLSVC